MQMLDGLCPFERPLHLELAITGETVPSSFSRPDQTNNHEKEQHVFYLFRLDRSLGKHVRLIPQHYFPPNLSN